MGRKTKDQKWREAIGRKVTKLNPEVVAKLKEAFAIGANVDQACFYAEIHVATYYRWCEKNPILKEEFARMKSKLPLAAKNNIAVAITTARDIGLSKWLVERQEPESYAESIKLKHSGNIESTPEEDKEAIASFHATLRANREKRSIEKAKQDGEIKTDNENSI